MIEPTVRQAMRISSQTVDLAVWVTSQATWSSKNRVWPAPWRAQGTWATVGPCSGQLTRRESACRWHTRVPRSSARQFRRPSPWSYPGARRPHRPHRRFVERRGRTWTTTESASSSKSTASITVCRSTPRILRHTFTPSTPFSLPCFRTVEQSENVGGDWRCSRLSSSGHPRICQESRKTRPGAIDQGQRAPRLVLRHLVHPRVSQSELLVLVVDNRGVRPWEEEILSARVPPPDEIRRLPVLVANLEHLAVTIGLPRPIVTAR